MKSLLISRRRRAFSLIEMLAVIAIIAVLAALIIPISAAVSKTRKIKLAQGELAQIAAAIDSYKMKLGFYPPDNGNPVNANTNQFYIASQLYYELVGTVLTNIGGVPHYVTRDRGEAIPAATVTTYFNRNGFANSSAHARATDEAGTSITFLNQLRPNQVGELTDVKVLVCSVPWVPEIKPVPTLADEIMNPWNYRSSFATNNVGTYDLWVDLPIGGKKYRINNWNKQPIIVP